MLKVLDLFSGIGGFSLGLERTGGFETVAFCEIDPFCQKVLNKHWPDVPVYEDVRTLNYDGAIDVITGGFPCQDISLAGNLAGISNDTRSGLWSEIIRLVRNLRPSYVIVENVANLLRGPTEQPGGWFARILSDLAECGYDAEWENIPAASLGAIHLRERAFIVAYPSSKRQSETGELQYPRATQRFPRCREKVFSTYDRKERVQRSRQKQVQGFSGLSWRENVRGVADLLNRPDLPPPLFRGSRDGVPHWVDRIAACGNAIIPQIAHMIGYAILEACNQSENRTRT